MSPLLLIVALTQKNFTGKMFEDYLAKANARVVGPFGDSELRFEQDVRPKPGFRALIGSLLCISIISSPNLRFGVQ